jgi:hypothetical protein
MCACHGLDSRPWRAAYLLVSTAAKDWALPNPLKSYSHPSLCGSEPSKRPGPFVHLFAIFA